MQTNKFSAKFLRPNKRINLGCNSNNEAVIVSNSKCTLVVFLLQEEISDSEQQFTSTSQHDDSLAVMQQFSELAIS